MKTSVRAYIAGVATAFPPHYYRQDELVAMLRRIWSDVPEKNLDRLETFHRNSKIEGRYLALPADEYVNKIGFRENNEAWIASALEIGELVLCELLDRAGLTAREVSHMVFTTITGLAVPSIDAMLMNRIPFPKGLIRTPVFGWGCMGGAAGLARVADYLEGHPQEAAVLLSIELCSLTLQRDDLSVANLVSSGLFGDGAGALLLAGRDHPLARPGLARVLGSQSVFFPETEYIMGYEIRDTGFKMILGPNVAETIQTQLRPEIEAFLGEHRLTIPDIDHWVAHPGGPRVLDAMENGLGLAESALQLSRESLRKVGNLSSASVLVILQDTIEQRKPSPGQYGLLMAFGPGFSAEMSLLQW